MKNMGNVHNIKGNTETSIPACILGLPIRKMYRFKNYENKEQNIKSALSLEREMVF